MAEYQRVSSQLFHIWMPHVARGLLVFCSRSDQHSGAGGNFQTHSCISARIYRARKFVQRRLSRPVLASNLLIFQFRRLQWPFLLLLQLMQLSAPTASKSTNCLRQPMALFSQWEYSFVLSSYFIRAAVYCNKVTTHA